MIRQCYIAGARPRLTNRAVYNGQPAEHEQENRSNSTSFSETSDGEDDGDAGEHALV